MNWGGIGQALRQRVSQLKLTSLGSRIWLWSFLPTALILAAVAGAAFWFYLQAAEELAVTQNRDLARYAAGQLSADLEEYSDLLEETSRLAGLSLLEVEEWDQALAQQRNRLVVFHGGVIGLDEEGVLIAAEPDRPELMGANLSDRSYFRGLVRDPGPLFSDVVADGLGGDSVIAVATPVIGLDGSRKGVLTGFFRIGETAVSAFYGDIIKLRPGGGGRSYLVDGQGVVIYHSDPSIILESRAELLVVQNTLAGETGASRAVDERGTNVLASFAPVPGSAWGLIIEQSWYSVILPVRRQAVLLAILFLIGVIVPGLIVTRGVRTITRPVVDLVDSATRIARGEYEEPEVPEAEGELGELAKQFTKVAAQLRAAQEDLEAKVMARTRELSMVLDAIQGASSSLELDQVLQEIAYSLAQAAVVSHCTIFLRDDENQMLLPAGSWRAQDLDWPADQLLSQPLDPSQDSLIADVIKSAQPLISQRPERDRIKRSKLQSALYVPLASKGRVLAVAVLGASQTNHEFTQADVDLCWGIATTAAVAIENAQLYMELQDRVREIEGLYRADEELHRYLDLEAVLNSLADVSVDIFGADKSSILVWDDEVERLEVRASRGFQESTLQRMSFEMGEGAVGQVALTRKPMLVEDTQAVDNVAERVTEPENIRAFMHMPVEIGDTFFGVFNVDYFAPHKFRSEEVRSFTALAKRAALAIQNARLYGQSKELAVYEERQRLARDLHDAVTQTLFSASLTAEVLPKIWQRDQELGAEKLNELRRLTRGALAEMRTLLLELRPASLAETDLTDLLRQLTEAATSRAGVEVDLTVEGNCPMPTEVKIAIYRVAQEAFNNIAKHAEASMVRVDLHCSAETGLKLLIQDDGRGFDLTAPPSGHLGLGIMEERAQEIDADITIDSQPGDGTRVKLFWQAKENKDERRYD